MSQLTDYTQHNTFQPGCGQQTRIVKYIRDLILNWLSQPRNIKDKRILSLLYLPNGELRPGCIKVDTPYDPDKAFAGTTPAIIISRGAIRYDIHPVNNNTVNPAFRQNRTQAPIAKFKLKTLPVNISVVTQSHDGTDLLAELLQLFLAMNCDAIRNDCQLLSYFDVDQISQITAIKPAQMGAAKQLYLCSIKLTVGSYITWTQDTQGPVFKGIRLNKSLTI